MVQYEKEILELNIAYIFYKTMEPLNFINSILKAYKSLGPNKIFINGKFFGMPTQSPDKESDFNKVDDDFLLIVKPDYKFMAVGRGTLNSTASKLKKELEKFLETNPDIKVHMCKNDSCLCDDPNVNPLPIGKNKTALFLVYRNKLGTFIYND